MFEGRLRSLIEEHSSDSRQHYFRNGILKKNGWRANLFSNRLLRQMNEQVNWKPYNYCRGNGWRFYPGGPRPSENVLLTAESLYLTTGKRRLSNQLITN